ncbi:MAG TPA: hypothetical protein PK339_12605 [Flavitalea sp.]|nr:hypothetical protein [Flavitalea sp.]
MSLIRPSITPLQKQLVADMLKGAYLMRKLRHDGKRMYKLYTGNMIPLRYYEEKTVDRLDILSDYDLLKEDSKLRITLHLRNVRRLSGKTWIKQQYKALRK